VITIADKTFYVSAEANQQVTVMLPGDLVDDQADLMGMVAITLTAEQARVLGDAIAKAAEIAQ
jgi:hypothetical protein